MQKNGHKSTVVSLSFSSDGTLLASAGKDRKLCIWKRNQTSDGSFFDLSAIVESAHKRIIWSTDFCEEDSSTLVTGSRDGFVKIWRVADNESGVKIKEMYRFQPKCKGLKKVEPVTATAFASMSVSIEVGNESISHGILAIGMECGLVEIWAIPLGENSSADCAPRVLHSIPVQDCHIGVVKKLAWRPPQKDEKGLTLASCSTDHGVRFYQLNLSL
jgi:WD40 repeat protein